MSAEEIALLNKFLHKTVNLMQNESVNISVSTSLDVISFSNII